LFNDRDLIRKQLIINYNMNIWEFNKVTIDKNFLFKCYRLINYIKFLLL
jgi:hypothetical protein